jgi:putative membrane protein
MMYGYGYGPAAAGGSIVGMLFMLFFGLLVVVGVVLIVVWLVRSSGATHAPMTHPGQPAPHSDTAMAVLRERLARGEITPEEYASIAKTLSGQ